jgi:hypothetical protein
LSLLAIEGASAANNATPLADKVRAANSRFKDANVAAAEGYAPFPCASGIDGGAMGVDYVTSLPKLSARKRSCTSRSRTANWSGLRSSTQGTGLSWKASYSAAPMARVLRSRT